VRIPLLLTLVIVAAAPAPAQYQSPQGESFESPLSYKPADSGRVTERATVKYFNKVDVPARVEGLLVNLKFEEGDTVKQGDVMAIVDDEMARLTLELKEAELMEAEVNASNDIRERDAKNSRELAVAEEEAFRELRRGGGIAKWDLERKVLEAKRTGLQIELAEQEQKIAQIQYFAKRAEKRMAEFDLSKHQVTSPATGYIETRIAQQGQWVQPGTPVATLIQMDRLRVEGDIRGLRSRGQIRRGVPVEITIFTGPDPADQRSIDGTLGYVRMEIDNINDEQKVWAEIENEQVDGDWVFRPGMKAQIRIKD